jgi:protein TonB
LRKFFVVSFTAHGVFLAGLIVLGTLLSHPPMSYYSVDLLSSLPSGSSAAAPVAPPQEVPPAPEPPVPVREVPQNVTHEAIKIAGKPLKKQPVQQRPMAVKPKPAVKPAATLPSWAVANTLETPTHTGAGTSGSNTAVSAKAGQPFPFPWYLKTVSDRLDKQWHAPSQAQGGTSCEVSFVIGRNGQVSDVKVSRASGDPFFDQVALHAVRDANPMPPLPSGFPEPVLKVHMTFNQKI